MAGEIMSAEVRAALNDPATRHKLVDAYLKRVAREGRAGMSEGGSMGTAGEQSGAEHLHVQRDDADDAWSRAQRGELPVEELIEQLVKFPAGSKVHTYGNGIYVRGPWPGGGTFEFPFHAGQALLRQVGAGDE